MQTIHQSLQEKEIPTQTVSALQTALGDRLVAVILFGSHARGEGSLESDWDMLIIAKELPSRVLKRHIYLKQMLPTMHRGAVSLLAKTPREFEAHLPSIYLDIALDGQVLYDPHGYAAERLATLQRLIEKSGLYRERSEAGDVWRWREEPSGPWVLNWEAAKNASH